MPYEKATKEEWINIKEYWEGYLEDLIENLYPLFAKYGISKAQFIIIYENRCIRGELQSINEIDEDDEKWKKQS